MSSGPSHPRAADATTQLSDLVVQLEDLREEMRRRYVDAAPAFDRVHPSNRLSAANLIDYLTLRHYDMREIQESLARLGLSSLGRAEEHVITTLERVIDNLHVLGGGDGVHRTESAVSFQEGQRILARNSLALLGPNRPGRPARILVTMPTEAARDPDLVAGLIAQGMDCARINCAHDDLEHWTGMVENIRRSTESVGRTCKVLVDLPGPKLRTGPVEPGPRVVRLRPQRDDRGRSVVPARAWLVAEGAAGPLVGAASTAEPRIPVTEEWLGALHDGEWIDLDDTRASRRRLRVAATTGDGILVEVPDTTYIATGTRLVAPGGREAIVGPLPAREQSLLLRPGDLLTLTRDLTPARAVPDWNRELGTVNLPPTGEPARARIGCTVPAVLDAVRVGDRVFFDDGKIGGLAVAVRPGEVDITITTAARGGTRLRAEKGINLPDTELNLPALGPDDLRALRFAVGHADLVGLSFAQSPEDVTALRESLGALGGANLGIVLKIETARGFRRLPQMLLAAMASERVGVMVARGDLAVECGFERLAEVQEEILWLCEAAHIPVIWATQVLDQMARTGQPSRAEISDAVMAGRAECVMLNKGPHITEAVGALDDILRRMNSYQHKKMSLLRRLDSWSPLSG